MAENPPNISARIVADSINPAGVRLTSWILRYPRFIHSEFLTHRCFSRNSASSRAIPFQKMVDAIEGERCAWPEKWGAEQKGMQSGDSVGCETSYDADMVWSSARQRAIECGGRLNQIGIHKNIANRLLEPFAHMTVLATATNHENFFALRAHPAAQPEFQVLAYRMLAEYLRHIPKQLDWGWWHIPRFDHFDVGCVGGDWKIDHELKVATARCARLSYLTQDGEHSPEKDIALHDRLLSDGHLSPTEHCALAFEPAHYNPRSNFDMPMHGIQGCGWMQYRAQIEDKMKRHDLAKILESKPDWISL